MLAEILIMRLEALARLSNDTAPAGNSRFVRYVPGDQLAFKDCGGNPAIRPLEPAPPSASSRRSDRKPLGRS